MPVKRVIRYNDHFEILMADGSRILTDQSPGELSNVVANSYGVKSVSGRNETLTVQRNTIPILAYPGIGGQWYPTANSDPGPTPPGTPAVSSITAHTAHVAWIAGAGGEPVNSFQIQYTTDPAFAGYATKSVGTALSGDLSNLVPDIDYYLRIAAIGDSGTSYSPIVTFHTGVVSGWRWPMSYDDTWDLFLNWHGNPGGSSPQGCEFHNLSGSTNNQPLYAPMSGTVYLSVPLNSNSMGTLLGNVIYVATDDGHSWGFCHMMDTPDPVGTHYSTGQLFNHSDGVPPHGGTASTGAHVHFRTAYANHATAFDNPRLFMADMGATYPPNWTISAP